MSAFSESLQIVKAEVRDIDFIVETIIEAEKSGRDIISSCKVFGLTEEEFKNLLREILKQDMPNFSYYLSGFLIAKLNGEYIGAQGSYFESPEDLPSTNIKAGILFQYLDKSKILLNKKYSRVINGLSIPREQGKLQIEHSYTREPYRRRGVFTRLIKENILRNLDIYKNIESVQAVLFKGNYKSYTAHMKIGFVVTEEKHVEDPDVLNFFPYDTRLLIEFEKDKIEKLKFQLNRDC